MGQEWQDENGWTDLNARFYMPDVGIFGQHDPLSGETLDPYGYAYNNPLFFADPTGMQGDPVNGGGGNGPDIPANSLGGSNNPYQIPEITLNAPIRAMASNPGSIMPAYCSVCYSGNGMGSGITLPAPQILPLPPRLNCGHCNDGPVKMIGGMYDPAGFFDILGQVLSNIEPESREQAIAFGAVAILATKGKAAPGIVKAEATGSYYSVAYEMKLAENLYPKGSYYAHFQAANKSLASAMASDAKFAAGISDLGIVIPKSAKGTIIGKSPKNWVWHHDVGTGIMQLAPKTQHTTGSIFWKTMHPNGLGGMKLWGLKSVK